VLDNIRDTQLHTCFQDLSKFILNYLNETIDFQTKELMPELRRNGVGKIFKKYFVNFQNSKEFKNFEIYLMQHDKYKKNFTVPVGTNEMLMNFTINILIENIFVDYLYKNGINWKLDILEQYYQMLEKFFIDDKFKIIIDTPVIGFTPNKEVIKIEDEISIIKLPTQRKFEFQGGTDAMKLAFAGCDLKIELDVEKIYEKISEENKKNNETYTGQMIIQNLMVVFRLFRAGQIGFLDSDLNYSIFSGGFTWQNGRCGLPNNWDLWMQLPYIFHDEEIDEIVKLRNEIQSLYSNPTKSKFIFSAIDRFMTSYEQDRFEDKILDLMISLEALLQTDIAELKFKLAVRTATFLETDPKLQNLVYKIIKEGYNVRSKTAHGVDLPKIIIDGKEFTLKNLTLVIEEIVRRTIKEFIKRINLNDNRKSIIEKLDDNLFLFASKEEGNQSKN
jgi:hypothetical protein